MSNVLALVMADLADVEMRAVARYSKAIVAPVPQFIERHGKPPLFWAELYVLAMEKRTKGKPSPIDNLVFQKIKDQYPEIQSKVFC